jgi:predicted 2-oxoglutarate/Fe(II)-dependent dioxygenase YbiX
MKRYYDFINVTHFIDFFTQEEYDEMYQELTMLCVDGMLLDAKEAGGATCPTGVILRNNKGLPVESVMDNSVIVNTFNKKMPFPYYDAYENVSHLINYYSDGHYYDYHKDKSQYTAISVFHKIPKNYSGGDLTFKDEYGIIIPELKPRDLIVFPGSLSHSVTQMIGGNRISVSRFMK